MISSLAVFKWPVRAYEFDYFCHQCQPGGFQGVCPEPRSDKDSLWVASLSNSKQTIFHGELFAREIILVLTSFLNTFDEFPDAPLNLLVL